MARNYHHLSLAERETIGRMRDARVSVGRIAAELGRHPATIYRELRRNFFYDDDAWFRGYFGRVAHQKASTRRVRGGKVVRNRRLASVIAERLAQCWSPEQIAGHLRREATGPITICHETIYQYVYGSEGRQLGLWHHLPRQRKLRRRRYARKPRGLNIPLANTIAERPKEIAERIQLLGGLSYAMAADRTSGGLPTSYVWEAGQMFLRTKQALESSQTVVLNAWTAGQARQDYSVTE